MTWHLRIWRPCFPTIPLEVDLPGHTSHTNTQFPIPWAEGEALVHLGRWSDLGTMACEIPALNLYQGVFWPALIHAHQVFWAFILHLSQLFSVTDFSGISQCADQQEGGAAELDFSDQGQLHLRSLTLCSLSSAPLLITAHVFPAECKGVTVSLENDACVDLQSKCVTGNL